MHAGDILVCATAERAGELAAIALELGQTDITIKTLDQLGGCQVTRQWMGETEAMVLSFAGRRRVDRILPMLPGGPAQSSDTLIAAIRTAIDAIEREAFEPVPLAHSTADIIQHANLQARAIAEAMDRLDAEAEARERWAGMEGGGYDGRN